MHIEIRRAKKKQGRWWIIVLDGHEIYREATVKKARKFVKALPQAEPFWNEPEPLET